MVISRIASIYDAVTFGGQIKAWLEIVGNNMPVRLFCADTPQIRGKCQQEKRRVQRAKQYTVHFLQGASVIELRNTKRGRYSRLRADLYALRDPLILLLAKLSYFI